MVDSQKLAKIYKVFTLLQFVFLFCGFMPEMKRLHYSCEFCINVVSHTKYSVNLMFSISYTSFLSN